MFLSEYRFMLIRWSIRSGCVVVMAGLLAGCGGVEERKAEYLGRGQKYFEETNYDKARVEFKNVLQIDPKAAKPYFYLGQIEESKQNWREAFGLYSKAVELDAGNLEAKIKLAKFYMLAQQPEKVAELLDIVLKAAPEHIEGRVLKAALANFKGDAASAIAELTGIVSQNPSQAEVFLVLAGLHAQEKHLDEAEKVLQRGLAENPGNPALQTSLAKLSVQLKKPEKAEELLKQLIDRQPEQLEHRTTLAGFYIQQQRLDDAERVYREAIRVSAKDANRYLPLVEFLVRRGKGEDAVAELSKAIADNPKASVLRFGLANLHEARGETGKAESVYRDIVALDERAPDALKAKNRLAVLSLAQGREDEALKTVGEVLAESPQDNQALLLQGRIALSRKDAQKAIASFRSVLKDQPDAAEVLNLLAAAHLLDGKPALAQESLEKAVAVDPKDFASRKNLVEFFVRQKNFQSALDKSDEFLKANPQSLDGLNLKADVLAVSDKPADLESLLKRIKADFPDDPMAAFRLGKLYVGQKKYDAALAEYEYSLRKSRNDYEPLKAIMGVYLEMRQPDQALARIKKTLSENPEHATAYQLLAMYDFSQKQEGEGIRDLNKAIEKNPRWPVPYVNLGAYYEQQGRKDAAVETYLKGVSALPAEAGFHMSLARVYEASGDHGNAIKQYEAVLKDHPNNLLAVNNIASLLSLDANDKTGLVRALNLAKRFESTEEPEFVDTLAWIYYQMGYFDKALPLQTKAVAKAPETPIFQYHLGMIQLKRGDSSVAKEHLRKAIESGKGFTGLDEAKKTLERLNT